MTTSQIALLVTRAAEEAESHGDPAVSPWLIGGIALALLLGALAVVVGIGGGREHS